MGRLWKIAVDGSTVLASFVHVAGVASRRCSALARLAHVFGSVESEITAILPDSLGSGRSPSFFKRTAARCSICDASARPRYDMTLVRACGCAATRLPSTSPSANSVAKTFWTARSSALTICGELSAEVSSAEFIGLIRSMPLSSSAVGLTFTSRSDRTSAEIPSMLSSLASALERHAFSWSMLP